MFFRRPPLPPIHLSIHPSFLFRRSIHPCRLHSLPPPPPNTPADKWEIKGKTWLHWIIKGLSFYEGNSSLSDPVKARHRKLREVHACTCMHSRCHEVKGSASSITYCQHTAGKPPTNTRGVVFKFLPKSDHRRRHRPATTKEGRNMPVSRFPPSPRWAPLYLMLISNFQSL